MIAQEEDRLLATVLKHPRGHWSEVAKEMPHRTDNQVRALAPATPIRLAC